MLCGKRSRRDRAFSTQGRIALRYEIFLEHLAQLGFVVDDQNGRLWVQGFSPPLSATEGRAPDHTACRSARRLAGSSLKHTKQKSSADEIGLMRALPRLRRRKSLIGNLENPNMHRLVRSHKSKSELYRKGNRMVQRLSIALVTSFILLPEIALAAPVVF